MRFGSRCGNSIFRRAQKHFTDIRCRGLFEFMRVPSFVLDEFDTSLVNNMDLREVVNSGWTKGQCVIRCDPDSHEPRPYSTFAPKALGMKGRKLPDTTLSRALIVALKRKLPDETAADFDNLDSEELAQLRQRLLRWTTDNLEAVAKTDPENPAGFHNRTRANWRLLLAIAHHVGGGWRAAAQRAAIALEQVRATFEPAIGERLLADIKAIFEAALATGTLRLTSQELVAKLTEDPNVSKNSHKPLETREKRGSEDRNTPDTREEGEGTCAHCRNPPDGTEQMCAIDDRTVWLHPGCQRPYMDALPC
jgi:putative DNA primase/helicase